MKCHEQLITTDIDSCGRVGKSIILLFVSVIQIPKPFILSSDS